MKAALFALVALLFVVNAAQAALFFCEDSSYDPVQPAFSSAAKFNAERAIFVNLRDYFASITKNVDLGNTTVETSIVNQLNNKLTQQGYDNTVISFTITRSNGDITMDTILGVNPDIDNHGGRYSLGKPMWCRDFATLVFDYTYVTRTGLQYRFWSQAVQTSVQKQWFSFRWNIPVQ
jgi:hypothetical protein